MVLGVDMLRIGHRFSSLGRDSITYGTLNLRETYGKKITGILPYGTFLTYGKKTVNC